MLGERAAGQLAEAQNQPPELCVRVNTLKAAEVDLGVPVRLDPRGARGEGAGGAARRGRQPGAGGGPDLAAVQGVDAPGAPARARAGDAGARPVRGAGRQVGAAGGVDGEPGRAGVRRAAPAAGRRRCARRWSCSARAARGSRWPMRWSSPTAASTASCSTRRAAASGVLAGRPDARWRRTLEGAAGARRAAAADARPRSRPAGPRRAAGLLGLHRPPRRVRRAPVAGGRQTLPHVDGTDGFYIADATRCADLGYRPPSDGRVHYDPAMREWPTTTCRSRPRSCLPTSAGCASRSAEVLEAGARVIHIDVMDGHFVPVITFGPKMVADLADLIHEHGALADVHLMIEQPERHIDAVRRGRRRQHHRARRDLPAPAPHARTRSRSWAAGRA